jgi:predicted nucleic acid-binding protein
MMYLDAAYLVRLYIDDPGADEVRALVDSASTLPASLIHWRAEVIGAFHRNFREARISEQRLGELIDQFTFDCDAGLYVWRPMGSSVITRVTAMYREAPATLFLRAGDALHVACALEEGYPEIYSNDTRLLTAARHFGLRGENVIK